MKRIFTMTAALLSIVVSTCFAQQKMGVEAGLISSNYFYHDDTLDRKSVIGIRGGPMFDFSIGEGSSLQTGLLYFQNGYTLAATDGKKTVKVKTIEVPFYFQFKAGKYHKKGMFIGLGPYIASNFKATITYEGTGPFTTRPTTTNTLGDGINKIDFGLGANLLYQFKFGLYLRCHYQVGFRDFSNEEIINNRNFGFTVGFMFDLTEDDIYTSYSPATPGTGGGGRKHGNVIKQ